MNGVSVVDPFTLFFIPMLFICNYLVLILSLLIPLCSCQIGVLATTLAGITDLYVHVAFDNIAGQKLYEKSGFVYEGEEPAWKARFLGRPRRLLLWLDMSKVPL